MPLMKVADRSPTLERLVTVLSRHPLGNREWQSKTEVHRLLILAPGVLPETPNQDVQGFRLNVVFVL